MKLREAGTAVKQGGGKYLVQLITPGQGSSGTYTEESIKQAGVDRIFKAGTLMMVDHATDEQEWMRPEGSIRDLAAVLDEDARWDDKAGALVAEAKVFDHWRPILDDMKDHIGVSIRAAGEVEDTADGRVVTKITEARSVDFVTKAGRGGKILEILESDRPSTLEGITQLFETSQPPAGGENKEDNMSTITIEASEHEALKDKASRLTEAESEVERLRRENEELKAEIAELKRQKAKEARREHVTSVVEEAFSGVQDPAGVAELLIESYAGEAEDDQTPDDKIKEAAKARAEKLGSAGQVSGMGQSTPLGESAGNSNALPTWDELKALKGA